MANEGTKQGLHIRNGKPGEDMWQAWDGETFMAGANGPMSLFMVGCFLDSVFESRHNKWGKESNPGITWLIKTDETEEI